jgi:glycosyltransferase involved in cell wall biosynthesis
MYKITIIIPHKNIPDLLQRCLDSIPLDENIQTIVVDDNSTQVDFNKFPGKDRDYTEVYFTTEGKGAGYARNVGLTHAKGKWILFADADDFFTPNAFEYIDSYYDSDYDLIFFGYNSVYCEDITKSSNREGSHNKVLLGAVNGDEKAKKSLLYKGLFPYAKMYRSEIINRYNFRFDEILASNDTMFGIKYALVCKNVEYSKQLIYTATLRSGSLVTSYKPETLQCRYETGIKLYYLLKKHGLEMYAQNVVNHTAQFRYISYLLFIRRYLHLFRVYPLNRLIYETFKLFRL